MILHEKTIISDELLEKEFTCNVGACKGACCVEGDYGAPLEDEEIEIIDDSLKHITPYMSQQGRELLAKKGFWETDPDNDKVTTCADDGACVFAYSDERGIYGCAIERSQQEGKHNFQKPISCHLYPIRISEVGEFEALNYDKWEICSPACALGKELEQPVYKFARSALIRKYGEAWFKELEKLADALGKA